MSAKGKYRAEIVSGDKTAWKARRAFPTLQKAVEAAVRAGEKLTGEKSGLTRHWVTEAREHMVDFGSHSLFGRITCDDPEADLGFDDAKDETPPAKPDPLCPEPIPLPDGAALGIELRPCPESDSDGRWPFTVVIPGKGMPAFVVRAKTAETAVATLAGVLYHALDNYEGDGDVTADD